MVATLFLIAIDPKTGRLVKRRRLRFRKALATCYVASWRGAATAARRVAVRELRGAGLIERSLIPGRYPIVAGSAAYKPFGQLKRAIDNGLRDERDITLFVLLAWSGVLRQRLTRGERNSARQTLKRLLAAPDPNPGSVEPIPKFAAALGEVAFRQEVSMINELLTDVLSGDEATFDLPGGYVQGGDGGAGGDSHHGGGHGAGHHGG